MPSIFGSLALQMLIMQAVRLAVVFFFGSPCTIIGRRALLKGASATQSNKRLKWLASSRPSLGQRCGKSCSQSSQTYGVGWLLAAGGNDTLKQRAIQLHSLRTSVSHREKQR